MPPLVASASRACAWLLGAPGPGASGLADRDWRRRHAVVCALLALHLPVVGAWAVLAGRPEQAPALLVPLAALLLVATSPRLTRRGRSAATALGLLTASALVGHLADGAAEAGFHALAVVAAVALYEDRLAYALALGLALLLPGLPAVLPLQTAGAGSGSFAALQAAALLAGSAVLLLLWRALDRARATEQALRAELALGRDSVQARIAETDRMRADLIGTVSHEFRTPLTGIRGAALTLLKRGDRLDKNGRDRLLHAVLDQQERLSRLLENMLVAAQATSVDPAASAEVDAVAAEVAMLAAAGRGGTAVSVVVEPGTTARIDRQALHHVLANLVDNALQHGARGSTPLVAGGQDDTGVWVTVSNEGRTIDLTEAGRLFEPFTQADSGVTRDREGIGVGLYVVRRLVEVYGGAIGVRSDDGWVTVELRLQAVAPLARTLAPASAPASLVGS